MTLKGDAIFKEKLTDGLKNDIRNLVSFDWSGRKSENLHFDELLLLMVYNIQLKKHRSIISHDTEGLSKLWRKTDFLFEKWNEEFGEFQREQWKV